jgi:hypothetical protein
MTFTIDPTSADYWPDTPADLRIPASGKRLVALLLAVVLLLTVAAGQAWTAGAETVSDLRDGVPTREEVRALLDEVAEQQDQALSELTANEAQLATLIDERVELNAEQQRLVDDIEETTQNLRVLAVESYITGGEVGTLEYLAAVQDASDFSWRQHLVRSQTGSTRQAVTELNSLYAQADGAVLASLAESERLQDRMVELELLLISLQDQQLELNEVMVAAEAWDRTAIAVEEGRYGLVSDEKWEKLRWCESSDRYDAVSPSGTYRGAYQFDYATWQTVGGTGDPALAPPTEQDARARELYARRGWYPWPVCGHFLK